MGRIFAEAWEADGAPPDVFEFLERHSQAPITEWGKVLLFDQHRRHHAGSPVPVEAYFERIPGLPRETRVELAAREYEQGTGGGPAGIDDFIGRFADLAQDLRQRLMRGQAALPADADSIISSDPYSTEEWDQAIGRAGEAAAPHPERIGKYRVERFLNDGGFKRVYLSRHEGLGLDVVIKVPRAHLVSTAKEVESFLAEARLLARLDHPGIVKVYDAGVEEDNGATLCYVVEKFIPGTDLAGRIQQGRLAPVAAASLVQAVAEALHHVHLNGLVHRDIKPANILIDSAQRPVVTDFGIALKREDVGKDLPQGVTRAYMSPEQARGEGHLVDGRSDIYSLGIVLYEALTGALPFVGDSSELIVQLRVAEIRPLRQVDDTIPRELERICLKALSRRVTDRYTTARDMAEDLRCFIARFGDGEERVLPPPIVPKGLRSFEAEDADFFLDLLPGPRDREGLPECVRFWKARLEVTDPDGTFRVGLLYGPSGCGKSSLLKAGILPRLAGQVASIVLEAAPEGTEARLVRCLRRRFPDLAASDALPETLAEIRRGKGAPLGTKVLLVIDQFEQWLHGASNHQPGDLADALRQCDGERVQCLLLVRDDFWMGVTRFLHQLEVPLVEGRNSAAVDLFDTRHARKVLEAFGRAYGALPPGDARLAKPQETFLDQAIAELEEREAVIPVRLALFAQMMNNKEWSPTSLKKMGGSLGIGVAFLEETFSSPHAPPKHKVHQKPIRAVLEMLLPGQGASVKGRLRSRQELLEASGCARRPADFDELLNILDQEVRLLAPVDLEVADPVGAATAQPQRRYQITHDYLIRPLREWLNRKRKETFTGRAQLRLAERSDSWTVAPRPKQLPSWWEWLDILAFTRRRRWSADQKRMMSAAGLHHLRRFAALLLLGCAAFLADAWWTAWRVGGWVAEARSQWERGTEGRSEMCQFLDRSLQTTPDLPALRSFLTQLSTQGTLRIGEAPPGAVLEVVEDREEAAKIGLQLPPGCPRLSAGKARFLAGERIPLTLGHYWVTVRMGDQQFRFPLFIGQVVFEKGPAGWRRSEELIPSPEVKAWSPAEQRPGRLVLAEDQEIPVLKIPARIPRNMALVPPGSSWSSRLVDLQEAQQVPVREGGVDKGWKDVTGYGKYRLERLVLEEGFLIDKDEVSVGELEAWLERFGAMPFDLDEDTHYRQLLAETSCLTAEELKRTWEGDEGLMKNLKAQGMDLGPLSTREELCRVRAKLVGRGLRKYRETLRKELEKLKDKDLPAPHANVDIALAYARTHAGIEEDLPEFEEWLSLERTRTGELVRRLRALEDDLTKRESGELKLLDLDQDFRLPRNLKGLWDFCEDTLAEAYLNWMTKSWMPERARFSRVLPVCSLRQWAKSDGAALDAALKEKLAEITKKLDDPLTEFYRGEGDRTEDSCLALIRKYGEALERDYRSRKGLLAIDKESFLGWLRATKCSFEGRLALLKRMHREDLGAIPWHIRLEFGQWQGWDLPTVGQWEKAFRGADTRMFPWGNQFEARRAWLGPDPSGSSTNDRRRLSGDVSPYDVWGMAGNLSEFVQKPPELEEQNNQILKGGNWATPPAFANGGCAFGVFARDRNDFTGFRTVRVIRKPRD